MASFSPAVPCRNRDRAGGPCGWQHQPRAVETRFGFPRRCGLERRIEGADLPFEAVKGPIARYLGEAASPRAHAQYVARLVSAQTSAALISQAPTTTASIEEASMLLGDLIARFADP